MLNKEICKKCINNSAARSMSREWFENDDRNWEEGIVSCPPEYLPPSYLEMKFSLETFPEHCQKRLEHAVANSVNIDKDKNEKP